MVYTGYVEYKINFPCYFQKDDIDSLGLDKLDIELNNYIEDYISNNPISVDYGNATITSVSADAYIEDNPTVTVNFSFDCDAYDDEDAFIGENSEIIQEFIGEVEDAINRILADHDIFGYLPEGEDVMFDGDSLYVRMAYHQDNIQINTLKDIKDLSYEEAIKELEYLRMVNEVLKKYHALLRQKGLLKESK